MALATSRREFIRFGTLGAAMVATAELPSVAGRKFEVGRLGAHSRLAMSYAVVRIGLKTPFSALHISDTHLAEAYPDEHPDKVAAAAKRSQAFGGRQEEALAESLHWARQNVDFVVHTGDLIDFKSRANFDLVKKYFGGNMFGSMGNHEFCEYTKESPSGRGEDFKATSWAALKEAFPVDPRIDSRVVNGVNFVALDDVFGTIGEDQFARIREEAKKDLPMVLMMHVPLMTPDVAAASWKYWRQTGRKFRGLPTEPPTAGDHFDQTHDKTTVACVNYLRGEKRLRAVLTGHEHLSMEERFSPTAVQYLTGGNFKFVAREVLFL